MWNYTELHLEWVSSYFLYYCRHHHIHCLSFTIAGIEQKMNCWLFKNTLCSRNLYEPKCKSLRDLNPISDTPVGPSSSCALGYNQLK